jgi:histidinol-phosphate aminotransferase
MKLLRRLVDKLDAYIPGEQPKIAGLIKLNTNENPYPPSPKVLKALKQALDARLRLYPNPTAQPLRERLARWHRCDPEQILVGNGGDEILALATRAFVEPTMPLCPATGHSQGIRNHSCTRVQFFNPSYSLYPVLNNIHGSQALPVPLAQDFRLPMVRELRRGGIWDFKAALTYITTPNAPSGRGYATEELELICRAQRGVVMLDETYADFAKENAMRLALELPNTMVIRTFSKAYSLCFQRVGYVVGPSNLIAGLMKIKDSYNVNGLGQVAALATLHNLDYYQANFKSIIASRDLLTAELTELGFQVLPSQANFIFTRPPKFPAQEWLQKLRSRKILVRWFAYPQTRDYLRISIGTEAQMRLFVRTVKQLLRG